MNDNKLKIMFGVNIVITCLGIFMIYKANKIDEQITTSVKTYLDGKTTGELKTLIDDAVIQIKQDNKSTVSTIVTSKITEMINQKIIEEMVKQNVEGKIQIAIDNQEDIVVEISN